MLVYLHCELFKQETGQILGFGPVFFVQKMLQK